MKNKGDNNLLITTAIQAMFDNMTDMFFVKDTSLVYISASQSFAGLVGVRDASEIIGKTDEQLFTDKSLVQRYTHDDRHLLASGKPLESYIEPIWLNNESRGYCQTSKFPLFNENGVLIGLYGIARDVTREYRAKLNYEQELKVLFELPESALGAVLFDVTDWRIVDIRTSDVETRKQINFSTVEEFFKHSMNSVMQDNSVKRAYSALSRSVLIDMYESGRRQWCQEYLRSLSDGTFRWVRNTFHFIPDPISGNLCIMSILLDIDGLKQAEQALARAAQRDSLTDVYNRETTMTRIRGFLTGKGHSGTHMLFMIDIDNFKLLNDTFGHQTGDETLVHIAGVIRRSFRKTDIIGRIGGDEFFALMTDVQDSYEAHSQAMKLTEALQYDCLEGDNRVDLSASIGISRYSGDGKSLDLLYREADSALYRAKQLGKNRFAFFDSSEDTWQDKKSLSAVNLRTLLENMDAAIFQTELDEHNEIRISYSSHRLFSDTEECVVQTGVQRENIWNVMLPSDAEALTAALKQASLSGTPLDYTCQILNPSGETQWRHICGTQLPDSTDGIRRMIHIVTDITQQKIAETELREKNSIIDFAMRNTDINLWYFDYEQKKCQLAKNCQKVHEMPGVDELQNFPECLIDIGYVREDCIDLLRSKYEELHQNAERTEFDVWFRKADGSGWWCERDMLSVLVTADGKVTHGIGIGKNVTAEKILEEKYKSFGAFRRLAEKNTRISFRLNLTTGRAGDCVSSSPSISALYEADTVEELLCRMCSRLVMEDEIREFNNIMAAGHLIQAFNAGNNLQSLECRYRIEDERVIWIRITVEMMRNPVTSDVEALLYSFDIDREKNMGFLVDVLLEDDYEFLGIIDVTNGKLMVFGDDPDNPDTAQNGAVYEDEMRRIFRRLIQDEYQDEGIRIMSCRHVIEELKKRRYYSCSFPARDYAHTRTGRKQWKFGYLDDSHSKILMARTDITSLYTAEYDSLTGLYNHETFYRHARAVLDANPHMHFILIRFDIDRFKAYNDVYGMQAGDRLLAAAGKALRMRLWPEEGKFGRLEADHFVILLPEDDFELTEWSENHLRWLESATEGYHLTSSVGIYAISDPGIEISLMCDRALLALRTVKDSYTRKIAWYDESLRERLMREQELTDDMEYALLTEQFVIYFQPLIDYEGGTLIGAEALIRWKHPVRGIIPPGEFIPLFEKNGFILKLDTYVWEKSCRFLREWIDSGKKAVPISVNVSRIDLYDPDLCGRFQALLQQYDLPYSFLKLEITESAYMEDPSQLIGIVTQLRSLGFTVEMDDFGSGYSSLNMLKDVSVDILKLDTHFISESENDDRSATILSSIIRMAHKLGLSIIAEGVETREQAESLKSLKCYHMQGYYFGRPAAAEDFEKLLETKDNMAFIWNEPE